MRVHLPNVDCVGMYSDSTDYSKAIEEVLQEIKLYKEKLNIEYSVNQFEVYAGFYWKFAGEALLLLNNELKKLGLKRAHVETFPYTYPFSKTLGWGRVFVEI